MEEAKIMALLRGAVKRLIVLMGKKCRMNPKRSKPES